MTRRINANRVLAIVLILLLLAVPGGCSGAGGKSLRVYILNWGNANHLVSEINVFKAQNSDVEVRLEEFDDISALEERLKTEIAAGKGPDVVISPVFLELDMLSLARSGAFYDLKEIIAADESFTAADYYTNVMRAGQIDGKQCIVPLSFTLPTFISSADTLEKAGIAWDGADTAAVYEQLRQYLEGDDTAKISGGYGYYDTLLSLMLSSGRDLWSYEERRVLLDEKADEPVVRLASEILKQDAQWMSAHPGMDSASIAELPVMYHNLLVSPNLLRYIYSAYAQKGIGDAFRMYIPTAAADGSRRALVQDFAAVASTCKNPETAWRLLRKIMDRDQNFDFYTAISLNRGKVRAHLFELTQYKGKKVGDVQVVQMPERYAQQLEAAYNSISDAVLYQYSTICKAVLRDMTSYVNGDLDYAGMMTSLQNRMNLYVNE